MRSLRNIFVVIVLLAPALSFASGPSFEGETSFVSNTLEGSIFIRCAGGKSNNQFCRRETLEPLGTHARFQVENPLPASRVVLRSTWENGRVITKRMRWDSEKERTKKDVNLWVDSLFQNPLLSYGRNDIEFEFISDEKSTGFGGQFSVYVEEGETLVCPDDSHFSSNPRDCEGGAISQCDRYFAVHNYCRR